ncbi:MAG TPA: SulP family inorganic anion transporter, partial [Myxococcales bacterium]|nr:SulP family inorganic anion transporter [Myxococcales bacterium]
MAAGAPPISGLISSIVAGLLATFLRGSQVAINGPGNALIVIIASAYGLLGPDSFPHILGAVAVSGAVQVA